MPVVPYRAALVRRIFGYCTVIEGCKAAQVTEPSVQSVIIAQAVRLSSQGQITDPLSALFFQIILCFYQPGKG